MSSFWNTLSSAFVLAPKGYREFIKLRPSMSMAKVVAAPVLLTYDTHVSSKRRYFLQRINELVNKQAVYLADKVGQDRWGPWRIVNGLRRGDCEDYAIHKLQALIANGFPRGALRLAVCEIIPKGLDHSRSAPVYHCVLLVYETGNPKPLILDNRRDKILRMDVGPANEYKWLMEELPGQGFWWRKLS